LESDTFALILTKTDPGNIMKTVDRIRQRVIDVVLRTQKGENIRVTVSCGIALASETVSEADTLVHNAREACAAAKNNGRNRVELHAP
jgi:diguanylate cyclase (GGDEF)-like protein